MITFFIFILVLVIYLFNSEKFCSEYWFQRKINKLPYSGQLNKKLGDRIIKLKYYYDTTIDFEIEIDNIGNLIINRNCWHNDSTKIKSYYLSYDNNLFNEFENDFKTNWIKNEEVAIDDHLGGDYQTISLTDKSKLNEIQVSYFNSPPNDKFIKFKDKLIQLAKSIKNSH